MPEYFSDLNLDQVVASITATAKDYDLAPFFFLPLTDLDTVNYRQDALRDLEQPRLLAIVHAFADKMRVMREHLSLVRKLRYLFSQEAWFLYAVDFYCQAVAEFARDLSDATVRSQGFLGLRDFLTGYVRSDSFIALGEETHRVQSALAQVRYMLTIKGDQIRVSHGEDAIDYSADVEATFNKFRQGDAKNYLVRIAEPPDMNHVEAAVLDLVAKLIPEPFAALDAYNQRHEGFLDPTIARFDREVQFYLAFLQHIEPLRLAGLGFCRPHVSDRSKEVGASGTFDLALGAKLVSENLPVVRNDFYLTEPERIFVVSGPNQGGKTTFARTFGQLHHLASLGLLVPGSEARLFLCDRLFTHFERQEDPLGMHGKLEDDLIRMHGILEQTTGNSIVILNEIFTSTTLEDAIFLGTKVLTSIIESGLLCVCVTFIDELASLGDTTVSAVSTVDPDDPAVRTYKVVRRPADGLAYAAALAQKYGLSYPALKGRLTS